MRYLGSEVFDGEDGEGTSIVFWRQSDVTGAFPDIWETLLSRDLLGCWVEDRRRNRQVRVHRIKWDIYSDLNQRKSCRLKFLRLIAQPLADDPFDRPTGRDYVRDSSTRNSAPSPQIRRDDLDAQSWAKRRRCEISSGRSAARISDCEKR